MKIKHFTHTDLDGVGCYIVSNYVYGNDVDVEFCDYDNVDKKVENFFFSGDFLDYSLLLITDISVNETVAKYLNIFSGCHPYSNGKLIDVILLDHHATAEWLNKYDWATVKTENSSTVKTSGTSLLAEYFLNDNKLNLFDDEYLFLFVEKVRRWDTWEWSTIYNDTHAKQINDLLYLLGRDRFISRFIEDVNPMLYPTEELILEIRQNEIDNYIDSKDKQLTSKIYKNEHGSVEFGVVFAERFHSELGNELAKRHPELDFIAMINPAYKTISYRGVKDIDLGLFARNFGGGGHPRASGSPISSYIIANMIDCIWDTE